MDLVILYLRELNIYLIMLSVLLFFFVRIVKPIMKSGQKSKETILALKIENNHHKQELAKARTEIKNFQYQVEDEEKAVKKYKKQNELLVSRIKELEQLEHEWEFCISNPRPVKNRSQRFKNFAGVKVEIVNGKNEAEARYKLNEKYPSAEGFVVRDFRQIR